MRLINRQAKYNFHILETFEVGMVLSGPEVKSIRAGRVNLSQSFAKIQSGELFLKNAYIYPYFGQSQSYDPRHDRKLLLHKTQINYLQGKISGSNLTLVPLELYETRNFFKLKLGLAQSKKRFDKKRAIKARDELRQL